MSTSAHSYTRTAIILHWLIAFLIIGQIIGGVYMHELDPGDQKYTFYQLHKSFGIVVLLLTVLRLAWRLIHKAPPLPDGMSALERLISKLTHIAFYLLMIGTPIVGWMMVSASPIAIPTKLFKTVSWPDFPGMGRSKELAETFQETHEVMAFALVGLLVLHVAAALKHHFIAKDDILIRMIPFLKVRG